MATVGLGEFDAHFSITVTGNETVTVLKETRERVRKTLQSHLNEPKVIRKIRQHFGLSQISDVRCKVGDVIVERNKKVTTL